MDEESGLVNKMFFRKGTGKRKADGLLSRQSVGLQSREFLVDDVRVVFTVKKVKNINMRIKSPDGHLEISAPPWVTQTAVEKFVRKRMDWVKKRQQSLRESPRTDLRKLSTQELDQYKERISQAAQPLVAHWEKIMGVQSRSLAYRNMTSRWGSCNPTTGRICLNVQLLNYPPSCLEYVIVHELCHLIERGHGPRFKALMDNYLPDWRERKALLK